MSIFLILSRRQHQHTQQRIWTIQSSIILYLSCLMLEYASSNTISMARLVDSRDIVEFQLKQSDYELMIRKKEALQPPPVSVPPMYAAFPPPPAAPTAAPTSSSPQKALPALPSPAKASSSSHPPLKSPMAGTFYRSPGPDEPPFVKVCRHTRFKYHSLFFCWGVNLQRIIYELNITLFAKLINEETNYFCCCFRWVIKWRKGKLFALLRLWNWWMKLRYVCVSVFLFVLVYHYIFFSITMLFTLCLPIILIQKSGS